MIYEASLTDLQHQRLEPILGLDGKMYDAPTGVATVYMPRTFQPSILVSPCFLLFVHRAGLPSSGHDTFDHVLAKRPRLEPSDLLAWSPHLLNYPARYYQH